MGIPKRFFILVDDPVAATKEGKHVFVLPNGTHAYIEENFETTTESKSLSLTMNKIQQVPCLHFDFSRLYLLPSHLIHNTPLIHIRDSERTS